jgi:hypothetical protein
VARALGAGWDFALGILGSALWAVAGFTLVEWLVRAALLPPGAPRPRGRIALLVAAKLVLYALAAWVLLAGLIPPLSCVLGFSLLLLALVVVGLVTGSNLRAAAGGTDRGTERS